MDQELKELQLFEDYIVPEPAMPVHLSFYFSIKNQSFVPSKSLYPDKVSGATETAGCRSLKGVRDEEKHGVPPEGRDTSESIDG